MTDQWYGTGRRKSSTARVYLRPGTGQVLINKRTIEDYFPRSSHVTLAIAPFKLTETEGRFDLVVNVGGGGLTGQAGAIRHGLSRALQTCVPELRGVLKKAGFLTRDSRVKERKKYGQRGARARFQFSKR
ncbi:MAG: 30S ribosomal protein S9 [Myxococcales bacterium]|nr:30S ribosomal protein S9 [Myxococcales bacterium]